MGAWQVVSLNCPRAAYKSGKDDEALFRELKNMMDMCIDLFQVKKKWMDIVIGNGRMPFVTQRPKDPFTKTHGQIAVDTKGLVYTIGVVGITRWCSTIPESRYMRAKKLEGFLSAPCRDEVLCKGTLRKHSMEIALARTPPRLQRRGLQYPISCTRNTGSARSR